MYVHKISNVLVAQLFIVVEPHYILHLKSVDKGTGIWSFIPLKIEIYCLSDSLHAAHIRGGLYFGDKNLIGRFAARPFPVFTWSKPLEKLCTDKVLIEFGGR